MSMNWNRDEAFWCRVYNQEEADRRLSRVATELLCALKEAVDLCVDVERANRWRAIIAKVEAGQ